MLSLQKLLKFHINRTVVIPAFQTKLVRTRHYNIPELVLLVRIHFRTAKLTLPRPRRLVSNLVRIFYVYFSRASRSFSPYRRNGFVFNYFRSSSPPNFSVILHTLLEYSIVFSRRLRAKKERVLDNLLVFSSNPNLKLFRFFGLFRYARTTYPRLRYILLRPARGSKLHKFIAHLLFFLVRYFFRNVLPHAV